MEKWINLDVFTKLSIFNDTTRVLHKLLMLAVKEKDVWKVCLNTNIRKLIIKDCNISLSSYYRAIKELEDCNFLIRDGDIYTLNLPENYNKMCIIFKK